MTFAQIPAGAAIFLDANTLVYRKMSRKPTPLRGGMKAVLLLIC